MRTRAAVPLLVALTILPLGGCVEREIRVESEPAGADVFIDGKYAGKTPHAESFVFYGTREISLRKDGFVTESRFARLNPPWFQILPLDLFFELLWPWTLRDDRMVSMEMRPAQPEDPNLLLERAKAWRENALGGGPK